MYSVRIATLAAAGLIVSVAITVLARGGAAPAPASSSAQADATRRIVQSAQELLTTLDAAGRSRVQFPFDGPQKTRWSNFPSGIFQRQGLRMGDLTPTQRTAVMNLLTVALSRDGYRKVTEIIRGDEVLRTAEAGGRGGGGGGRGAPGGGNPGGRAPGGGRGGGRGPGGGPGGGGPGGDLQFGQDALELLEHIDPLLVSVYRFQIRKPGPVAGSSRSRKG